MFMIQLSSILARVVWEQRKLNFSQLRCQGSCTYVAVGRWTRFLMMNPQQRHLLLLSTWPLSMLPGGSSYLGYWKHFYSFCSAGGKRGGYKGHLNTAGKIVHSCVLMCPLIQRPRMCHLENCLSVSLIYEIAWLLFSHGLPTIFPYRLQTPPK